MFRTILGSNEDIRNVFYIKAKGILTDKISAISNFMSMLTPVTYVGLNKSYSSKSAFVEGFVL